MATSSSTSKNVEALIGGDFAGYMGTFSPRDGSLIPIPTYLVPSALLEWGQEPSSLEVIVSEEECNSDSSDECVLLKRQTITALPAIGCGVDNLETTKSQQVFATNATNVFESTSARTLDVVKAGQDDTVVELETIFGLAEEEAHRLRVSMTLQILEQDSMMCMIQSPIRVHLERQSSPVSSRGTVADGGGLDGRTVSTRIGTALKQHINFADRPPLAKGRIWTTGSSSDKEEDTTFSATGPTIISLPGNVEIVSGPSKDDEHWIIQVCHFTPNLPNDSDSDKNEELLVGTRRMTQRSFATKRSGAAATSSSAKWTTTFLEQEGEYRSSSSRSSSAA